MARLMDAGDTHVYRAVIVRTDLDGGTFTNVAGPYRTHGAAKAAIAREQRYTRGYGFRGNTVTGHVESAALEWVPTGR